MEWLVGTSNVYFENCLVNEIIKCEASEEGEDGIQEAAAWVLSFV